MSNRLLTALLVLVLLLAACSSGDADESAENPAQDDVLDVYDEGGEDTAEGPAAPADDERPDQQEEQDRDDAATTDSAQAPTAEAAAPDQPIEGSGTTAADQSAEDTAASAESDTDALDAYLPPPTAGPEPEPTVRPVDSNPFVDTDDDPLSTFGLDVDTGSYALARAAIDAGRQPDPDRIRIEEFVNAFDYDYEVDRDETFTVQTDVAPWPFASDADRVLLRVGLATPEAEERQPASLVFVVDTSGSMSDLLPLVQDSLHTLTDTLRPGDEVAIVTYSDEAEPVLRLTDVDDVGRIHDGIDDLRIGGSTNLEAGLDLGYDIAGEVARDDRTTRVILASDGIANVGNTGAEAILDTVAQAAADGVELVTVGFGLDGFNDPLMEQLADRGDGFYAYVDTLDQAEELFAGELIATRPPIARDARAQVIFDEDQVTAYRLLGYENRDIADEDFRDDAVDAGELVAGHTVTALYELELAGRNTGAPLATVQLRWLDPQDGSARERAHDVTADDITREWQDTPDSFRLAGTVAAWAMHLRDDDSVRYSDVADQVDRLADDFDTDETNELAELVERSP